MDAMDLLQPIVSLDRNVKMLHLALQLNRPENEIYNRARALAYYVREVQPDLLYTATRQIKVIPASYPRLIRHKID